MIPSGAGSRAPAGGSWGQAPQTWSINAFSVVVKAFP